MTISNLPAPLGPAPMAAPGMPQRGISVFDLDGRESGVDWRRILSALLRFNWLIATTTLVGTIAGVGATRFLKPQYSAQAKIWIDVEGRRGPERGPTPIRSGQLLDAESWVDLLESYVVLDQVVRDQRLYVSPNAPADARAVAKLGVADQFQAGAYRFTVDHSGQGYTLATADGVELERGTLGDSVGSRYGLRWVPDASPVARGRVVEFTLTTLRDAATSLGEGLDARMDQEGSFLRLELRGANPVDITAIVNAVAQRYVTVYADLKRQKLIELTKILGEQLQHAQENLHGAEAYLQRFREETIALPGDRPSVGGASVAGAAVGGPGATGAVAARDPVFGSFFDMQISREQARRDRDALDRLLAQAGDSGLSAEALSVVGLVQANPELTQALTELMTKQAELRALRYKYSDAYPPVQRLLGEIATLQRQTIPTLARQLAGQLAAKETELGRRVDADSRTLKQIPARAIEEARLRRDAALAENLYLSLQGKYDEARLAEASTLSDVRVLDSAVVPRRPVKNTRRRVILLAFFGSFAMAVVGAVLIDRVDPRVRYPDQVSREMGLTILGAVPHIRAGARPERSGRRVRPPEDVAVGGGELLGSQTMSQLLTTLRPSYDVILVDSPPLSAGVDPLILGTLTGHLVVVLRTGFSHRDMASAKLEVLQRLPVRLLGAILNAVPAGEAYRYYSYYLPGYETVDEEAGRASGGKGQPFVI